MKIRPMRGKAFVKVELQDGVTKGGIVIPDNARKELYEGTVMAVGKGPYAKDGTPRKPTVKVGQVIILDKFIQSRIETDHGPLYVADQDKDILAILG